MVGFTSLLHLKTIFVYCFITLSKTLWIWTTVFTVMLHDSQENILIIHFSRGRWEVARKNSKSKLKKFLFIRNCQKMLDMIGNDFCIALYILDCNTQDLTIFRDNISLIDSAKPQKMALYNFRIKECVFYVNAISPHPCLFLSRIFCAIFRNLLLLLMMRAVVTS